MYFLVYLGNTMDEATIAYVGKILDTLRGLSESEKRLMLAFIENRKITISQLLSLGYTYGLSGIDTIRTLIMLINKNLVIPIFRFPEDPGSLLTKTPFAGLFLSFLEIVDMKKLSRKWRDRLEGIINELKRGTEDLMEIGMFGRIGRPMYRKRVSPWSIIGKFYEVSRPEFIISHIEALFNTEIPDEDRRGYIIRMLSYALLSIWRGYYLAKTHGSAGVIERIYPYVLERALGLLRRESLGDLFRDRGYIDTVLTRASQIISFACEAIKELFFVGIEPQEYFARELLKRIDHLVDIISEYKPTNMREIINELERARSLILT